MGRLKIFPRWRTSDRRAKRTGPSVRISDSDRVIVGDDNIMMTDNSTTNHNWLLFIAQRTWRSVRSPASVDSRTRTSGKTRSRRLPKLVGVSTEVVLWGPPGSGKSTYVAALDAALSHAIPPWTLTARDDASMHALIEMNHRLRVRREFPDATSPGSIGTFQFLLAGDLQGGPRIPFLGGTARRVARINLSVADPAGQLYDYELSTGPSRDYLAGHLAKSHGIILFFDPTAEHENAAYKHFHYMAANLMLRSMHQAALGPGGFRLPHRVAVCVSKFDTPEVFMAAKRKGYLCSEGNGSPRVAEKHAEDFFDLLCQANWRDGRYEGLNPSREFRKAIKQYFYDDKVRYFAVSSVGFYLGDSMRFDEDDFANTDRRADGFPIIRGTIHPINILEPLVWVSGLDRREAASPSKHRQAVRAAPVTATQLPIAQRTALPVSDIAGAADALVPEHLICLVEASNSPYLERYLELIAELVTITAQERGFRVSPAARADGLGQHDSAPPKVEPVLPVSLIAYGSSENSVSVLAWKADHVQALRALDELAQYQAGEDEHTSAAHIECALAEVTRQLAGSQERIALVTVGSSHAFPIETIPYLQVLPCPEGHDWRALLAHLRLESGAILGAIHDHDEDAWTELGADADAHVDTVDIWQFAVALGLTAPSQNTRVGLMPPEEA